MILLGYNRVDLNILEKMTIEKNLIYLEKIMSEIISEFFIYEAIQKNTLSLNSIEWIIISNSLQNSYSLKLSNIVSKKIDQEVGEKCFSLWELLIQISDSKIRKKINHIFKKFKWEISNLKRFRDKKIAHQNVTHYKSPIKLTYKDIYSLMEKLYEALKVLDNHINQSRRIEDFEFYIKWIKSEVDIRENVTFKKKMST